MTAMNIAIAGASGRMGRILIEAVENAPDARLAGALGRAGSAGVGTDAAAFLGKPGGVLVQSDLSVGLAGAQYLIDFTRPEGTLEHLAYCAEHGIKLIIGTTGFDDAGKAAIAEAAKKTAIVYSPNFSVGVNVTMKLLERAAKALATGYDIEVIEAHHRFKVDAPSGTALKMGEVIAGALGQTLPLVASVAAAGSVDMAMLMQQSAMKAGLKLTVKRISADGYWSNHWMKSPMGFGNINPRPSADMLFTQFFKSDAPWNESGWQNEQFDQLLLLARAETDEAKRKQFYADMQVLVHQKCGIGIPLFINNLEAFSSKVRGTSSHPLGSFMGYTCAEQVWLEA